MTNKPFELEEALSMLAATPLVLEALMRGLPSGWVGVTEGAGTWSPFDVIGHLIHGERTDWIPRAKLILREGDRRSFEPFDRFAQVRASAGRSLSDLLDEFSRWRATNLQELAALHLQPSDLDKQGRHPELGLVTLRQLLATWVAHDYDHIIQISRVVATQYADEVGPWKAYLRVISGTQG